MLFEADLCKTKSDANTLNEKFNELNKNYQKPKPGKENLTEKPKKPNPDSGRSGLFPSNNSNIRPKQPKLDSKIPSDGKVNNFIGNGKRLRPESEIKKDNEKDILPNSFPVIFQ